MTTLETIIHLATALVPSLSVLAFMLIHRRQHIQADLQDQRQRLEHRQMCRLQDNQRAQAMAAVVQAIVPAIGPALTSFVERVTAWPNDPPLTAADLGNQELVDELRRRIFSGEWPSYTGDDCCAQAESCCAQAGDVFDDGWSPGPPPRPSAPEPPPAAPSDEDKQVN